MLGQYADDSCTLLGYLIQQLSDTRWCITHSLDDTQIVTNPHRTLSDITAMIDSSLPLYAQDGVDPRDVRMVMSWPTALELYAIGVLTERRLTSGKLQNGDLAILGVQLGNTIMPVDICQHLNQSGSSFGLTYQGTSTS